MIPGLQIFQSWILGLRSQSRDCNRYCCLSLAEKLSFQSSAALLVGERRSLGRLFERNTSYDTYIGIANLILSETLVLYKSFTYLLTYLKVMFSL